MLYRQINNEDSTLSSYTITVYFDLCNFFCKKCCIEMLITKTLVYEVTP